MNSLCLLLYGRLFKSGGATILAAVPTKSQMLSLDCEEHRIAQRTSSKSPGLGEGDRGVCLGMAMVGAYRLHDSYGDE